jgi:hypothetical protein
MGLLRTRGWPGFPWRLRITVKRAHGVAYAAFYVVEPTVRHEETRSRRAGLSAVQKGHEESRWNRLIERGIIEPNR